MTDENGRARRLLRAGLLEVDLDAYRASFEDRQIDVSASQLQVLATLIENEGRVVSREKLAEVAGVRGARSIDALLSGLRKNLPGDFVRNVRKRGWILVPEALQVGRADRANTSENKSDS